MDCKQKEILVKELMETWSHDQDLVDGEKIRVDTISKIGEGFFDVAFYSHDRAFTGRLFVDDDGAYDFNYFLEDFHEVN